MIFLLLPLHNNLAWDPPVFVQAPEQRSLSVAHDPRQLAVVESRTLGVEPESRRIDVATEPRTLVVDAENRRLS